MEKNRAGETAICQTAVIWIDTVKNQAVFNNLTLF